MEYKNIYFVGIGGIGMSALARWFMAVGKKVGGYDKTPTDLTDTLQNEGMHIHFEDNLSKVPSHFLSPADTLIIYTPAIPKDHTELRHFQTGGFTVMKRSEVLGLITKQFFTVAVGGTHGKTTTSSMLAYLLHNGGVHCHAFLGGIAVNFNSNLLISNGPEDKTVVVVEADEYDRSFLRLFPNITIITAIEADHLDIYGTEKDVEDGYMQFIAQNDKKGRVVLANNIKKNS